jgi:hypothetical protein
MKPIWFEVTHRPRVWRGKRSHMWRWDCPACSVNNGLARFTFGWRDAYDEAKDHADQYANLTAMVKA